MNRDQATALNGTVSICSSPFASVSQLLMPAGQAAEQTSNGMRYTAIGRGWRSRTTWPVNVEPVVPVSST
jgi:hypothetical protein